MGLNDVLGKVTDQYERNARLVPALLALLPIMATLSLLYGPKMSWITNIVGLAVSCGVLYLLSNIARDQGKRLEEGLFEEWGGIPTTQLLRHRDHRLEGITKRRYHAFPSQKIGAPFPDAKEEARRPWAADDVYQSGVRWLRDHTRDTDKFKLLYLDNISYGFHRNALGLKPWGIAACIASLLLITLSQRIFTSFKEPYFVEDALAALSGSAIAALALSGIMLVIWIFYFTKARAKSAAFGYAYKLLEACDVLEKG